MHIFFIVLHFLLIISISAISLVSGQLDVWAHECSDAYGNYTSNSTYKSNLNKLFTNISNTNNIPYGFYSLSAGQDSDQVNAIALCRGDVVKVSDCHACLDFLISNLTGLCPNQMEAIGWAEKCMLRYSTRSILGGVWSNHPMFDLDSGADAGGDVQRFGQVVQDLLTSLPNQTADGDSRLKFATGEAKLNASTKVYGMMQCTPDLIPSDCLGCLYWGLNYVLHSDTWKTGMSILLPSCFIRYDLQKFYSSLPPPPPASAKSGHGSGLTVTSILLIVGGVVCLSLIVTFLVWYRLRRRRREAILTVREEIRFEPLKKDYSIIRDATSNFSELLGRGGFGAVYKGTLDGREIAVKRLERRSISSSIEFKNEVVISAKVQHTNLAELIGYCVEGEDRLLIFVFVSNGSLDKILFDEARRAELDWEKRFNIIEGIAQGLQYLHQFSRAKIIHRDLKPANVLLDTDLKPVITDFGTARLFLDHLSRAYTAQPAGTRGYMAPEYFNRGEYSAKSDVYSFGIVVLEIIAGRRSMVSREPGHDTWLISKAWRNWRNDKSLETVDPTMASTGDSGNAMKRCIHIALLCVQESVESRPQMDEVLYMLNGDSSLASPSRPLNVDNSSNSPVPLDHLFERRGSQSFSLHT